MQLLICLAIGNIMGALIWNPPARSWELGSWVSDSINSAYSALNGTSQAQTPLPVPQNQPPIGNSNSMQPCFSAPSPVGASPTTPVASTDRFKDPKAKILMNLALGNQLGSVYSRLHSPDSTNGNDDFYQTTDGLIKVTHDDSYRVTAIGFVS